MIFADIHGKLGAEGQRAHERSEDLLTSTAFGLLRYLPFEIGIGALLRRVRVMHFNDGLLTCTLKPDWIVSSGGLAGLEFWPRLPGFGEPDLRLTLDRGRHVVLIEVKLYSGKSQIAEQSDEDDEALATNALVEEKLDPDQLARYHKGQRRELAANVELSIIYLTAHAVPPEADLTDSLKHGPMRLGWLSWRDVWAVAEDAKRATTTDGPAADLARLLRHKGFSEFAGFDGAAPPLPDTGRFWNEPIVPLRQEVRFFEALRDFGASAWSNTSGRFFTSGSERFQ